VPAAEAFTPILEAYADRSAAARAHAAAGGKVAGYMSATVPIELVRAAGFFPLLLSGRPGEPTPLADRYMEDLFDPVVRSVFEDLLAGRYDFLDVVLLPRTSDSIQRLYYYLCELKRVGAFSLPEIVLVDLLHTPWYSSAEYNFARFQDLRETLGRLGGVVVDDQRLAEQIVGSNRRTVQLQRFAELRRGVPAHVAGSEALKVLMASRVMADVAFDAALAAICDGGAAGLPPQAARTVVAGSALDQDGLHRLIERLGGTVVGDHHGFGDHLVPPPIRAPGDPLRALASHYHRDVLSTRTFPVRPEGLAEFALAAKADAVVFYFYAEEEALTWEAPAQRRALEAAGVESLSLPMQPYVIDEARVSEALAPFLAKAGAEEGAVQDA
jgi:benzoyl-CoA reductase/2-hydroxyglutaryl-CoA dehydratase subunit BcrC/BadD/HgdB